MLYIKFKDGTRVQYVSAVETEEFYNNASRRTLTFRINPVNVNLQTLSDLCTEENLSPLELINEVEGITNIYEGYVLKLAVGSRRQTNPETGEVYEFIELKLGKRTYIEQRLHELGLD